MPAEVRYADAEPSPLASMLGGIIQSNLASRPELEKLLERPVTYGLIVTDAEVAVSLRVRPGEVTVRDGVVGRPHIRVEADALTLAGLSSVPLRFGLPDVLSGEGRQVVRKLLTRRIRIRGMLVHAEKLARLTRLLSLG